MDGSKSPSVYTTATSESDNEILPTEDGNFLEDFNKKYVHINTYKYINTRQ